jgi:5-hydroxyisourate hydrolase
MSSPITTHVLDTARGCPAAGVDVKLERGQEAGWEAVATGVTNDDGRVTDLMAGSLDEGFYRLTFDTGRYHQGRGFYPEVTVVFQVDNTEQHYHVPLLLSPYGYSTYRGS